MVDVTVFLRMTGARASRTLDLRSKQIPLTIKASRKRIQKEKYFHTCFTPEYISDILGKVLALVQKFSLQDAVIPHLQEPSYME